MGFHPYGTDTAERQTVNSDQMVLRSNMQVNEMRGRVSSRRWYLSCGPRGSSSQVSRTWSALSAEATTTTLGLKGWRYVARGPHECRWAWCPGSGGMQCERRRKATARMGRSFQVMQKSLDFIPTLIESRKVAPSDLHLQKDPSGCWQGGTWQSCSRVKT